MSTGIVELNWKIIVSIIAAIIAFAIILLVILGFVTTESLSEGAANLCRFIVYNITHVESLKSLCDLLHKG